jgi:hypothetical protein
MDIWYIFPVLVWCTKKNLATLSQTTYKGIGKYTGEDEWQKRQREEKLFALPSLRDAAIFPMPGCVHVYRDVKEFNTGLPDGLFSNQK